jgi:hypothetical protein
VAWSFQRLDWERHWLSPFLRHCLFHCHSCSCRNRVESDINEMVEVVGPVLEQKGLIETSRSETNDGVLTARGQRQARIQELLLPSHRIVIVVGAWWKRVVE